MKKRDGWDELHLMYLVNDHVSEPENKAQSSSKYIV